MYLVPSIRSSRKIKKRTLDFCVFLYHKAYINWATINIHFLCIRIVYFVQQNNQWLIWQSIIVGLEQMVVIKCKTFAIGDWRLGIRI